MKVNSYKGSEVFFTSDLHFSHAKIIEYCKRPYKTPEEMNAAIILNWNAVVKPTDTVFVLGDVSFDKDPKKTLWLMNCLNGTIHLVRGNHDEHLDDNFWLQRVSSVSSLSEIKVDGKNVVLCHFPMMSWNKSNRGSWQLFGHMHGAIPDPKDRYHMDVGVDTNAMRPYSWDEIKARMATKKVKL